LWKEKQLCHSTRLNHSFSQAEVQRVIDEEEEREAARLRELHAARQREAQRRYEEEEAARAARMEEIRQRQAAVMQERAARQVPRPGKDAGARGKDVHQQPCANLPSCG
jgi:hypothetical protein